MYHDGCPVHCFKLRDSIVPAARDKMFECPLHGKIEIVHLVPDLVTLYMYYIIHIHVYIKRKICIHVHVHVHVYNIDTIHNRNT